MVQWSKDTFALARQERPQGLLVALEGRRAAAHLFWFQNTNLWNAQLTSHLMVQKRRSVPLLSRNSEHLGDFVAERTWQC
jgi:hypothetical protein